VQLKSVKTYLFRLIKDGHKWQYLLISGKGDKPKYHLTVVQWILLCSSIIAYYFFNNGLNNEFVGYIINALSIFIGLFLTLILSVFDKFKSLEYASQATELDEEYRTQRTNFFKQFTALTSYAIVIAVLCILLLSITFATEKFKLNIFHESFISSSFGIIIINTVKLTKLFIVAIYNVSIIYFLLDFLLIVIYAVTSMHTYMMIEYNKEPKTK
jgi:hypothetical protein